MQGHVKRVSWKGMATEEREGAISQQRCRDSTTRTERHS